MNNLTLKSILLTCLSFFFYGQLSAQTQEVEVKGEKRYVYPFQQEIGYNKRDFLYDLKLAEKIKRDSLNRAIVSTSIEPVKYTIKAPKNKNFKKNKSVINQIRSNYPHFFYRTVLNLESDLTPVLEPMPDGKYVMYYRDLPFVSKDNVLSYNNTTIAAYFSLKNNLLDGPALWVSPSGDTLKYGLFKAGNKEGKWVLTELSYDISYYGKLKLEDILANEYTDTTITIKHFLNGISNGEYTFTRNQFIQEKGSYKNGVPSGEWTEYRLRTDSAYYLHFPLENIVNKHYFLSENPMPTKAIIIRTGYQSTDPEEIDEEEEYYGEYEEGGFNFGEFYTLHIEKEEEGLELKEEKFSSYSGGSDDYEYRDMYDGDYDEIEDIDFSYSYHNDEFMLKTGTYTRNKLIDSIGYDSKYEKLYEEFHPNGKLKLRMTIENGKINEPDTIFWDNGAAMSTLYWLKDSSQYIEQHWSRKGKLITEYVYDKKGDFVRFNSEATPTNIFTINKLKYQSSERSKFFNYGNFDTLNMELKEKVILSSSLWKHDSLESFVSTFDPTTREFIIEAFGVANKNSIYKSAITFNEDYENLMGVETFNYKNWRSTTLINGSYYHSPYYKEKDTILNSRVYGYRRKYETTTDNTLYFNDKPYSGKFEITQNNPLFSFSGSAKGLKIQFSNSFKNNVAQSKAVLSHIKGKKTKLDDIMTESIFSEGNVSNIVAYNLVQNLGDLFDPIRSNFFIEREYTENGSKTKKLSESQAAPFGKKVVGQFLNGKPEGKWITYDQKGRVLTSATYKNGELEGQLLQYTEQKPLDKKQFISKREELTMDSMPEKPVYYLYSIETYKNGLKNGPSREMNWRGDTLSAVNYIDGRREGFGYEKTKIAYSEKNFEGGYFDGTYKTYLTLPGKDTALLFDLNYQSGRLQGECKSFHLNGKLAKHGFFLGGEPIDDFEAFDTLGFKYQYVKFQFSQPIEEKIWEENELSVRYTFDWRDSIPFNAEEITNITSLERLLSQMGYNDEGGLVPYYGRPSVLNKNNVNYHLTKYYPNDSIARDGAIEKGKKVGCWMYWNYEGKKLYEVEYKDSIMRINDSVKFKSKGILTYNDSLGNPLSKSYIVEKIEKYDCSHTDHHEIRMLYCFWEKDTAQHRRNGYVKNYYDNGVLMNEGLVKDGLATGVWKFYDPYGSLNLVGEYVQGKRNGRWLSGDLSSVKYMGDICLNPNLPNLDEIMSYQEKLLDISVIYYRMSAEKKREYYGVNMNADGPPDNYEEEYIQEEYYDGEYYDGEY